ncbi:hypothetical protein L580_3077 [Serratia fonticola AU-P3(3)]|nr:hypothetical protein L580_3077 [Serratia fonticola AU-P3(3)]
MNCRCRGMKCRYRCMSCRIRAKKPLECGLSGVIYIKDMSERWPKRCGKLCGNCEGYA